MPSVKGGCPRPSFRWQFCQARELNSGPSPSEASVGAGADTEVLRKMALPILKSSSRLKSMLPEEAEKALALVTLAFEVVPPPGLSSPSSVLEKSVAGAVRPGTLASVPVPWLSQAPRTSGRLAPSAISAASERLRGETGFGDAPHSAGTTRQRDLERFRCNRPTSEPDLVKNSWSNVPQTQPHFPRPSPWQAAWCSRSQAAPRNSAPPEPLNRCRSRAPDRKCRYRRSQWRSRRRAGDGSCLRR